MYGAWVGVNSDWEYRRMVVIFNKGAGGILYLTRNCDNKSKVKLS